MTKIKLKDCLQFQQGVNLSRLKKQEEIEQYDIYGQGDFDIDLHQLSDLPELDEATLSSKFLSCGELVISTTRQKMTVASEQQAGKLLPLNFIRAHFTKPYLDKGYLLYLFNEEASIRAQIDQDKAGRSGAYKLSIKVLQELEVPLLPLKQQVLIGRTYLKMIKVLATYQAQMAEIERVTLATIAQIMAGKEGQELED